MKKRLQRILSILCVLALAIAGLAASAFAENAEKVTRVITVNWDDEDNYDGLRPGSVAMTIGDATVTLSEANGWTGETEALQGLLPKSVRQLAGALPGAG